MTQHDRLSRLNVWLAQSSTLGPECRLHSLDAMAGGQSSELMLATVEQSQRVQHIVIRLEQRGRQLFLTPDIAREFQVIEGIFQARTVPVPEPLGLEPTGDVLGTPFLAMRRVQGAPLLGRPSMHLAGPLPAMTLAERSTAAMNGIAAMAAIHAIDWRKTHPGLDDGAAPETALDRHLARIAEWYAWATQGQPHPVTDRAMEFLLDHRNQVRTDEGVLLWGDARPGNILFDDRQQVAAVLDWEGAFVGPRTLDVAYWVMSDLFHADAIGIDRLPGWPDEAETIATYERQAGVAVTDLDYFIVLGALFMGTTLIRATTLGIEAGRLAAGSRMGMDNSLTQIIAQRLGLPIPPLSPDFIAHRNLPAGTVGLVI